MRLTRRDGADFGVWVGARRERSFAPVTDERRGHTPKGARRFAVALCRPPDIVVTLARATSPRCAPLLADERHRAITVGQPHAIPL